MDQAVLKSCCAKHTWKIIKGYDTPQPYHSVPYCYILKFKHYLSLFLPYLLPLVANSDWRNTNHTNVKANLTKDFLQLGLQYRFNLEIVGIQPSRLRTKGNTTNVLYHVRKSQFLWHRGVFMLQMGALRLQETCRLSVANKRGFCAKLSLIEEKYLSAVIKIEQI